MIDGWPRCPAVQTRGPDSRGARCKHATDWPIITSYGVCFLSLHLRAPSHTFLSLLFPLRSRHSIYTVIKTACSSEAARFLDLDLVQVQHPIDFGLVATKWTGSWVVDSCTLLPRRDSARVSEADDALERQLQKLPFVMTTDSVANLDRTRFGEQAWYGPYYMRAAVHWVRLLMPQF